VPLKVVKGPDHPAVDLTPLKNAQALIVETNATSARLLATLLSTCKIASTIAPTPEEGESLARHRTAKFSLVFCNVEYRDRLVRCRELGGARLILMGVRGKNATREMSNTRNTSYLPKPILRRELLAVLAQEKSVEETEKVNTPAAQENRSNRLQVLLVEDNRINQIVARRLIERYGGEVAVAADGREAVEALDGRRFDVVFMDIQMPGMDGLEVTREIREREKGTSNHQYIVAMTAHAMAADRERCLAAGMDDYLSKPVQPPKLQAILEIAEARMHSALPPR